MNELIDSTRRLVRRYPLIKDYIVNGYKLTRSIPVVGNFIFNLRWRAELRLLGGDNPTNSRHNSIIHFTLNRSASQFIKRILCIAVDGKKVRHVDWSKMAGHSEYPYLDKLTTDEMKRYKHFFRTNGYLYSHFGGFVKGIDELEKYKVILIVRDPRDLLVSKYYSVLHSHILPVSNRKRELLKEKRREAKKKSIDNWAKENYDYYKTRLNEYKVLLLDRHPGVHVGKFEDMISSFDKFVGNIFDYCNLEVDNRRRKYIKQLMRENKPKEENVKARNKSGRSKQYERKLKNNTIKYLNEQLKEELDYFNYEI